MASSYSSDPAYLALKQAMDAYYPLSDDTWSALCSIVSQRSLAKGESLYAAGEVPQRFAFVYQGLFRIFINREDGQEYNKMFFEEGQFPGSTAALLTSTPSAFTVQALEPSIVLEIAHQPYRQLLHTQHDLALFWIHYLEANWLLAKEPREVALVQEDATQRYHRFAEENPSLTRRLPQYLIASHLGITPTQLSRIKKVLKNQPM
ncbi:Crp/Fnr family transcriptional regulator [Pseudomaricurvus sp.]|uniref:Crp/Fnr family transcriptional regulator n=1 Tax=Pseudomaricurvus sp. TaxID=2004510 RepID=UPI003F6CA9D3